MWCRPKVLENIDPHLMQRQRSIHDLFCNVVAASIQIKQISWLEHNPKTEFQQLDRNESYERYYIVL